MANGEIETADGEMETAKGETESADGKVVVFWKQCKTGIKSTPD